MWLRWRRIHLVALAALLAAACGGGPVSGASSPASSPSNLPSSPGPTLVTTGTATVSGSSETVLTDSSGMTLYQFTPDAAGKVACTGGCAAIWPPLLLPAGTGSPSGSAALSAGLGTVSNPAGGLQVTYNHWPLYTYSHDTAPGQAGGQGVAGKWYVATPTLKAPASTSGSSTVPGY